MPSISEIISTDLVIPVDLVDDAVRNAYFRYRKVTVPKRRGGSRIIVQPAAELKVIHSWLVANLLGTLPISAAATAFHTGASILKNARVHKLSQYSVRVDIKDFFPSIRSEDLLRLIEASKSKLPSWVSNSEVPQFLRKACFDRHNRLPIGYPTSPIIANAVMFDLDNELLRLIGASPMQFGQAHLTRYADDFVFSTDKIGACQSFVEAMFDALTKTTSPRLSINGPKTRFMSRKGGSTLVTGLRINQSGVVRVHPTYRDHVRLLLKLYSLGRLEAEEQQRLIGHLAHIEHVDPQLFTRLSFRYFAEISTLRSK